MWWWWSQLYWILSWLSPFHPWEATFLSFPLAAGNLPVALYPILMFRRQNRRHLCAGGVMLMETSTAGWRDTSVQSNLDSLSPTPDTKGGLTHTFYFAVLRCLGNLFGLSLSSFFPIFLWTSVYMCLCLCVTQDFKPYLSLLNSLCIHSTSLCFWRHFFLEPSRLDLHDVSQAH